MRPLNSKKITVNKRVVRIAGIALAIILVIILVVGYIAYSKTRALCFNTRSPKLKPKPNTIITSTWR